MRVQVVYYLSHGGQMEQPHLIEVEQQQHNSVFLSDVKKRLTLLRGKGMPDAFSWAYKRSYKNDFVWNDVTENDLILPVRENEYVIKGSENVYSKQDHRRDRPSARMRIDEEQPKNLESPIAYGHRTPTRASESYDKRSSMSSSSIAETRSPKNTTTTSFNSLRVNRQLMETLTQAKTESVDEAFSHSNGSSNENNFTDVKVYKTAASPVTADHGKDAATQTEEHSERISDDFHFHREVHRDPELHSSTSILKKADRSSLVSAARKQIEDSSRKQANAAVLRQLLACGGIDTSTCSSTQSNRVHYPAWSKIKADETDIVSNKLDSNRMPPHSFSSGQDPETIPEVVKETTNTPAGSVRFLAGKASREAAIDASSKTPNRVRVAAKIDENSPRLATAATKRVVELKAQFSPSRKDIKCREDRPLTPGRSRLDWEKTLQEAVNASSPPVGFRSLLQECPQCGRTFKPDSLKVHLRGCHGGHRAGKQSGSVARRLE